MWPIKTCLFFVGFAGACALSLAYPIVGVVNYMLVYLVNPGKMWWGVPLDSLGLRYSLTAGVCLFIGISINSARIPRWPLISGWDCLLLLFTSIVLLSNAIGLGYTPDSHTLSDKMVKMTIFLLCLSRLGSTRKHFRVIIWTLVVGTLIIGNDAYHAPPDDFFGGRLNFVGGSDFRESSGLAAHMAAMLPLVGAAFMATRPWRYRLVALASGVLAVNTIVQCRTRSAFVGLIAGLAVAILAVPRGRRVRIYAALIMGLGGIWALTDDGFVHRMETLVRPQQFAVDQTIQSRIELWTVARSMFQDHPFGVGVGRFRDAVGSYNDGSQSHAFSLPRRVTHNSYLLCLTELGVQGIVVFSLIVAVSLFRLWRCHRMAPQTADPLESRLMTYGCLVSLVVYLVASVFTDRLYTESYWWVIALPICLHRAMYRELYAGRPVPALAEAESDWRTPACQGISSSPFALATRHGKNPGLRPVLRNAEEVTHTSLLAADPNRPATVLREAQTRGRAAELSAGHSDRMGHGGEPPDGDLLNTPYALPSGLCVQDLEVGVGKSPAPESTVIVDYVGYREDGTIFDRAGAVRLDLSTILSDVREGILSMREAGRRRILIPKEALDADVTLGEAVSARGKYLVFEVTLLSVEPRSADRSLDTAV